MNIAIPAWLASLGIGAGQIASYLAVIALPGHSSCSPVR